MSNRILCSLTELNAMSSALSSVRLRSQWMGSETGHEECKERTDDGRREWPEYSKINRKELEYGRVE